jgi:hypothetical protein
VQHSPINAIQWTRDQNKISLQMKEINDQGFYIVPFLADTSLIYAAVMAVSDKPCEPQQTRTLH